MAFFPKGDTYVHPQAETATSLLRYAAASAHLWPTLIDSPKNRFDAPCKPETLEMQRSRSPLSGRQTLVPIAKRRTSDGELVRSSRDSPAGSSTSTVFTRAIKFLRF